MIAPTRPVLRYHGGKWRLRHWITSHLPPHRIYLEPFGGGGSILLSKARCYLEIYNDLDGDVVNLFRVLRNPETADRLRELIELTPFARQEFFDAYEKSDDPVEAARRMVVRSFMGHGSSGVRVHRTGFRGGDQQNTSSPMGWRVYPDCLGAIIDRLRGVEIENVPAAELIAKRDRPDTLIYADPPYLFETRSQKRIGSDLYHGYRHELSDDEHRALLEQLVAFSGMVVLSGYPSEMYDEALVGWSRYETTARADGSKPRTEVLWVNPAAAEARRQRGLFDGGIRHG